MTIVQFALASRESFTVWYEMFMKLSYLFVALLAIVLTAAVIYVRSPKGVSMKNTTSSTPTPNVNQAPAMAIDPAKHYSAVLHTTEGDITIALTAKETPKTVNNFVYLARKDFYNNTIFHRIISGFMIQGGDPRGNGTGGPGYAFDDEPFTGKYTRGTVAMANAGPNTNGSQFFIMHQNYDLDPLYVIFGHVVDGMNVVDKIATAPTIQDGRENSRPVNPVTVQSVTISEQ